MISGGIQSGTDNPELSVSRRSVLSRCSIPIALGLAGCFGDRNTQPTQTADQSAPIESILFEAQELVVRLHQGHNVRKLNLIAPDDSLYTQSKVAEGARSVRLQIVDIQPGMGGFEHYDPGMYELVAVTGNGSRTQRLELRPNLRITDVKHYTDGNVHGNLAITIENRGTAPTWPYQVTYRNAPNEAANSELSDNRGVPQFLNLDDSVAAILSPGESRLFVGGTAPMIFDEDSNLTCTGQTIDFTTIVGTATNGPLERQLRATVDGERVAVGMANSYTCSEIGIRFSNREEDDT